MFALLIIFILIRKVFLFATYGKQDQHSSYQTF